MVHVPFTHLEPEAAPHSLSDPQAEGFSGLQDGGVAALSQMKPKMQPFATQSPAWQVPSGAQVSPAAQSLGWPQ